LIAYSIETALSSNLIDRVVVSTDDDEIAAIARQYGAEVPFMRPAALAGDDSPEWLTWQHAIRSLAPDADGSNLEILVCVPPTSPLRSVEDIDACIIALLGSDADLVITVKEAERNPYFNMVTLDDCGDARIAITTTDRIFRRQDAPQMYDITTVAYAARPEFVLRSDWMFQGKVKGVLVPAERALDIDTELDLAFAEFLLINSRSGQHQIGTDATGQRSSENR